MRVQVVVSLKTGILDPESQAILQAVHGLGETNVKSLTQQRQFVLDVATDNVVDAKEIGQRLARDLLANPVMQTFQVTVEDVAA